MTISTQPFIDLKNGTIPLHDFTQSLWIQVRENRSTAKEVLRQLDLLHKNGVLDPQKYQELKTMTESLKDGAEHLSIPKTSNAALVTHSGNKLTAIQRQKALYLAALSKQRDASSDTTYFNLEAPSTPRRMLKTEHKVWNQHVANAQKSNALNSNEPSHIKSTSSLQNDSASEALTQSVTSAEPTESTDSISGQTAILRSSAPVINQSSSRDDLAMGTILERVHLTTRDEFRGQDSMRTHGRKVPKNHRSTDSRADVRSENTFTTWFKPLAGILAISGISVSLFLYGQQHTDQLRTWGKQLSSTLTNTLASLHNDQTSQQNGAELNEHSQNETLRAADSALDTTYTQASSLANAPNETTDQSLSETRSATQIETDKIYAQLLDACNNGKLDPKKEAHTALNLLSALETAKADNITLLRARSRIAQAYLEKARIARQNKDWATAEALVTKAIEIRKTSSLP